MLSRPCQGPTAPRGLKSSLGFPRGANRLGPIREPQYLSQDEGNHISRLPVTGMEEVGQSHCGEGGKDIWAVQSIVNPLGSPPLGCDCGAKRKVRTESTKASRHRLSDDVPRSMGPQHMHKVSWMGGDPCPFPSPSDYPPLRHGLPTRHKEEGQPLIDSHSWTPGDSSTVISQGSL